jgi:hypothetical protein
VQRVADKVRVFLSSTWEDLQAERHAVEQALHRMQDADFVGMEYFGSRPETPLDASLSEVDRSHVYVGIFGQRYGSGITEAEYLRARERGLPCLIYQQGNLEPCDDDTDGDSKIEILRHELASAHIVTTFRSPDDLAMKVATDVHRTLAKYRTSLVADMSPQDRRNRSRLLARVSDEVARRLSDSLEGVSLIALGLQERPEAVPTRRGTVLRARDNRKPCPVSVHAIADVFDGADGELLILGAPGSGKSTTLLDLARTLIRRAQANDGLPIPVIFYLSSWGAKRYPISLWLADELAAQHGVPRSIARTLVSSDSILPLLDGLDEVAQEHQAECVAAINFFRASRVEQLASLVVSSRLAEYDAIPNLELRSAVLLQPLSEQQIDAYLASAGGQMEGLRAALRADSALEELSSTPLLLNLMILTYRGTQVDLLPSQGTVHERRSQLLSAYIERVFTEHIPLNSYFRRQAIHWLSWLARTLSNQSQTIFHVEQLQPEWLPTRHSRRLYTLLDRLGWGLVIGLPIGAVLGLGYRQTYGPHNFAYQFAVVLGPAIELALAAGVGVGLFGGVADMAEPTRRIRDRVARSVANVAIGLLVALLVAVTLAAFERFALSPIIVWLVGNPGTTLWQRDVLDWKKPLWAPMFDLFFDFGPFFALLSVLTGGVGLRPRRIVPVETVRWSLAKALGYAAIGLIVGASIASAGIVYSRLVRAPAFAIPGVIVGFSDFRPIIVAQALMFGAVLGAWGGITAGRIEVRTRPNEGMWRSARRSLFVGVVSLPITILVLGLLGSYFRQASIVFDLMFAFVTAEFADGMAFALVGGLAFGGQACLSHLALRSILLIEGWAPMRLNRFLDATERAFTFRIGGGYIFVHRLLQEHFAEHEEELIARVSEADPSRQTR